MRTPRGHCALCRGKRHDGLTCADVLQRAAERAAIVAWLRDHCTGKGWTVDDAADEIENGAHLTTAPQPPEPACPSPSPSTSSRGSPTSPASLAASSSGSASASHASPPDPAPGAVESLCAWVGPDHERDLVAAARAEVEGLRAQADRAGNLVRALEASRTNVDNMGREVAALHAEVGRLTRERDTFHVQRDQREDMTRSVNDMLTTALTDAHRLRAERDALHLRWHNEPNGVSSMRPTTRDAAREQGRREGWDEGVRAAHKAWGKCPTGHVQTEEAAMLALLGACPAPGTAGGGA